MGKLVIRQSPDPTDPPQVWYEHSGRFFELKVYPTVEPDVFSIGLKGPAYTQACSLGIDNALVSRK